MKNMKPINLIVALLAIMNIAALVFCWVLWGRVNERRLPPPERVNHYLITELKLTKEQQQQFRDLGERDRGVKDSAEDAVKSLRRDLFLQLKSDNPDTAKIHQIAQQIGQLHAVLEMNACKHFGSIRAICNDEQKKHFDEIIGNLAEMLQPKGSPPGPRQGPPRGDGPPPGNRP
jgi:Spy/CpxP family protein refolding chaperone